MAQILQYSTTLTKISCGECHIPFAVPSDLHETLVQTGRLFWCPNGHKIGYSETENDRLKKQLSTVRDLRDVLSAQLTHSEDQRRAAERSAAAFKGQATRLRKRSAAGVCPVPECHRHFENLARHMSAKHPGFSSEENQV
jgi:hypothetical protein